MLEGMRVESPHSYEALPVVSVELANPETCTAADDEERVENAAALFRYI